MIQNCIKGIFHPNMKISQAIKVDEFVGFGEL